MAQLVLVDQEDREIGTAEKLKTHQQGRLHRAFSILIFNSKGDILLQKRAKAKYHSGGLWTNACCSHPGPGLRLLDEAQKRLKEEMGFSCPLKEIFSFVYRAELGELTEHEFDHVLVGKFEGEPKPNPEEADDWKWMNFEQLKKDVKENPQNYTFWFKLILANDKIKKV